MGADGRLFVILNAQHVSSKGSEVIIKPSAAPFVPYCLGRGAGLQTARAKKKVLKRSAEKVIPQRKASGTKSRFAQQTCVQDPTGKKVTASRAPGMSSPLQPGSSSKCFPWYAFNITSLFLSVISHNTTLTNIFLGVCTFSTFLTSVSQQKGAAPPESCSGCGAPRGGSCGRFQALLCGRGLCCAGLHLPTANMGSVGSALGLLGY